MLNANYSLYSFLGSNGAGHHVDPPKSVVVSMDDLCAFLAQPEYKGSIDEIELFWGSPVLANCVPEDD